MKASIYVDPLAPQVRDINTTIPLSDLISVYGNFM